MNPPSFTSSTTTTDTKIFVEELEKVFESMHVVGAERVQIGADYLKSVAWTWFDQLKKGRAEGEPVLSWSMFKESFLGRFFSRDLRDAKVQEFLPLRKIH